MKAAFVAGATGYTGRAVVSELVARGVRTVAHVRPDSPRLTEWRTRFGALGAEVDATPWQLDALGATIGSLEPACIFALLGTTRARARRDAAAGRDASYQAIDYGLSRLLLDATRHSGATGRFIYLSALGTSTGARNEYLAVRWKLEQEIATSGLDYVIARPAFIAGADREESRPVANLIASILDGALNLAGALGGSALREQYASMTGAQLGRALVVAAISPDCARSVLDPAALRRLAR